MPDLDLEIIGRVLVERDHAAFGELVRRHQSSVRHFLRHLTRHDVALAEDLAQETFVRAFRSLSSYRGDADLSTWLLGIAFNQWRNARRRQRDTTTIDSAHDQLVTPAGNEAADLRADLAAALRELSSDEQLAVHLAYQQGLSHSQIAALTGWPLGTVKTHLARGKDKLRQHLSAWNSS